MRPSQSSSSSCETMGAIITSEVYGEAGLPTSTSPPGGTARAAGEAAGLHATAARGGAGVGGTDRRLRDALARVGATTHTPASTWPGSAREDRRSRRPGSRSSRGSSRRAARSAGSCRPRRRRSRSRRTPSHPGSSSHPRTRRRRRRVAVGARAPAVSSATTAIAPPPVPPPIAPPPAPPPPSTPASRPRTVTEWVHSQQRHRAADRRARGA